MSRTVTAIFESREEAEAARARLASAVNLTSTRMLAKDTAAAVDDIKIDPKQARAYREALLRGDHLLVAQVARGEDPKRIIQLLRQPGGAGLAETEQSDEIGRFGDEETTPQVAQLDGDADDVRVEEAAASPPPAPEATPAEPQPVEVAAAQPQPVRDEPPAREPEPASGGTRVRSTTREAEAEEQVALKDEHVEVENRPAERRLSEAEIEAGGLLQERVIEIVEMREEPVVTKEVVVREEVIVRKTVNQRTETIRDTVRRTEVEVEELSGADDRAR